MNSTSGNTSLKSECLRKLDDRRRMAQVRRNVRAEKDDQENRPSASEVIKTLAELQLTNKGEGKVLFIQGTKNNWSWRPMCYASQNFRAYYTLQLFNARVNLTTKAIEKAIEEGYVPQRFFKTVKSVASLGCGPGSDLCGVKTFLSEAFPFSSRGKQAQFIGYDLELGWMHYLHNLGFDFENVEINRTFVTDMKKVDVILMSFCAKELCCGLSSGKNDETLWKAISQKAKFVLVVDNEKMSIDFPSEKDQYKQFTLNDILGNKIVVYCYYSADD